MSGTSAKPSPDAGELAIASPSNAALATLPQPPPIPDHELSRRIGGGAYGEVWLARSVLGQQRAVKIIFRSRFNDPRPFEREFEGIQRFEPISRSHSSQLAILHVGKNDSAGCFYYVMELADPVESPTSEKQDPKEIQNLNSGTCEEARFSSPGLPSEFQIRNSDLYAPRTLRHDLEQKVRLPIPDCLQIGLSLTTALAHLHQHGLVHRDIKPSNVIFVKGVPKLGDIGLVTEARHAIDREHRRLHPARRPRYATSRPLQPGQSALRNQHRPGPPPLRRTARRPAHVAGSKRRCRVQRNPAQSLRQRHT